MRTNTLAWSPAFRSRRGEGSPRRRGRSGPRPGHSGL